MSIHAAEQRVMDLYEDGKGPYAIAAETGMRVQRVRKILAHFREKNEDFWAKHVAQASAQLRDACLRLAERSAR